MTEIQSLKRSFSDPAPDLNGRDILVTGGTGSFGHAFTRAVLARYKPNKLIIFSRDEMKQYEMEQLFSHAEYPCIRYFIGDVRDCDRLEMAMRNVDFVIHAAAMKHVSAAEYNPFECIHTNVLGAENVVKAAIRANVRKVIALSTDKAANPANLYGASKLASDKIFVAANHLSSGRPIFSVVRYGNVIGSRGSVVPLFRKLLAGGVDHLPITHPDMTRFWITLDQAVNFVFSCVEMMLGGEIFVPKIPSMRIIDMARAMAPDMEPHIIGIRPGEKLHEIMITEDDARSTVRIADRYIIEPMLSFWAHGGAYKDAEPVPDGFCFASNTNPEQLDATALRDLLEIISQKN